jgi:hypothetical protein
MLLRALSTLGLGVRLLLAGALVHHALARRQGGAAQGAAQQFFSEHAAGDPAHTNNWAVLVCASRYWFNYRVRS